MCLENILAENSSVISCQQLYWFLWFDDIKQKSLFYL